MTPDAEQLSVIRSGPDDRLLVVAGPGAGKTAVITERVRHLLDEGYDRPGDVLVLSFSRAAVAVVGSRLEEVPGADAVDVRTLDSLAAEILAGERVEGWEAMSFDARIRRAVELLAEGAEPDVLEVEHVVVDEAQDLVGDRADLVLAVLRALHDEGGFTVLGDPLQGIYDFQLDGTSGTGWKAFSTALTSELAAKEVRLSGDYRSRTDPIREAVATRHRLLDQTSVGDQAPTVSRVLSTFPTAGSVGAFARFVGRWQGRTAVLTWTNGEALLVWDRLWGAGLDAYLQPRSDEVVLAPWIGAALAASERLSLDREDFERVAGEPGRLPHSAWDELVRTARGRSDRLDLGSLARALVRESSRPALEMQPEGIVVSTVHRAKGLEFDNVVLVDPLGRLSPAVSPAAQTVREAYVAMTRGKSRVVVADWTREDRLRVDKRTGRWIRPGRESWMTFGFEVRGRDSSAGFDEELANGETQRHLRDHVRRGDRVDLVLDPRRSFEYPVYRLVHDGRTIGRTNLAFGEDFSTRVRARASGGHAWPDLVGVRVEAVETSVFPTGVDGRPRFLLNARVAGMAGLEW